MIWAKGYSPNYIQANDGRYTVAMYGLPPEADYVAWFKPEKGAAERIGPFRDTQEAAKADAEAHKVREVTP